MTQNEENVSTRVGNVPVRLPVYRDRQTTETIAAEMSVRLAAIEQRSSRIDTQGFLTMLAYEYAVETHGLRGEQEAANRAFLRALDGILNRLRELCAEHLPEE
jgi:hypothetical protein